MVHNCARMILDTGAVSLFPELLQAHPCVFGEMWLMPFYCGKMWNLVCCGYLVVRL